MYLKEFVKYLDKNKHQIKRDSTRIPSLMFISLIISLLFKALGFNEANIILTFMTGVVFTAYFTESYVYGILASMIDMLFFNFFLYRSHLFF